MQTYKELIRKSIVWCHQKNMQAVEGGPPGGTPINLVPFGNTSKPGVFIVFIVLDATNSQKNKIH
jgi:hypothetical protein